MTTLDSAPRSARTAAYVQTPSGIYTIVVALFCGLLLISNIAATKLITVVDGLPAFSAAASSPTVGRCSSR